MIEKPFSHAPAAPRELPAGSLAARPVRHWLLVQVGLSLTGWAVILLGVSCFV
jgi:hypothetical protein